MEVEKLQRYDLVERIAAGGMGEVFRARATGPHGFEKTLAVKRVLPELSSDEEFVERFVRECKLSVSLSHANIVQVFDLGRAGQDLFLVMEFVHGSDLARLLLAARAAGRQVPIGIALLILAEAAEGLAYAHGRYGGTPGRDGHAGIIHCDISPSNLLLSYAGEVKLTDFGVAQLLDRTRRRPAEASHVMGKWRYMAPEQIRGEAVDGRTDLYALGVVLYEVLAGRKAFGGDGIKATCDLVLAGDVPPLRSIRPEVPEALADLVARVMSVDPRQRPADARVFLEEIAEIRRGLERGQDATALDLGALVRDLVPPPPDVPRRGGLGAFLQPMIVEKTGDHSGSIVRRRKPAASFMAPAETTGSNAVTQWIPATGTLTGWPALASFLGGRRMRWRVGSALLLVIALFIAAAGVGLATGLRMRRPAVERERLARHEASAPGEGEAEVRPAEVRPAEVRHPAPPSPAPPIEAVPRELAALLPHGGPAAPRPAAPPAAPAAPVARPSPAYLDIYVEPWANVVLDGHPLDKPTPLTKVQVKPGSHHLVLDNPVLKRSKAVDVTVAQGQTQKVEIYLVDR